MPEFAVDQLEEALGTLDGKEIQILGLAYRGGVKEDAFSGAYRIRDVLQQRGAIVSLSDPMYTDEEITQAGFFPAKTGATFDGSVIHTDHAEYRQLLDKDVSQFGIVFDGRNILEINSTSDFESHLRTLGRGGR
jgi:UDP-N-acetyl-D-mannosaminuronate dehydrogenase